MRAEVLVRFRDGDRWREVGEIIDLPLDVYGPLSVAGIVGYAHEDESVTEPSEAVVLPEAATQPTEGVKQPSPSRKKRGSRPKES